MPPWIRSATLAGLILLLTGCTGATSGAFDRGIALYNDNLFLSAKTAFDEAIREEPRLVAAYANRGITKVRVGDPAGAVRDYARAIELSPQDAQLYFNRGNAYVALGNYGAAQADYNRAVTILPGFAKAYFNRGTARFLAGDLQGAQVDWQHAAELEIDPWVKAAMRRSAGLEAGPPVSMVSPPPATIVPAPALPPVAPPPGVSAPPSSPPPAPAPALTPEAMDARALATRAISRELDGDRAGALADLRTALGQETDRERRASIEQLIRMLERSP